MTREPEWAVNPRGEVMLVISPPLSHAPTHGRMAGRDRYVLTMEDGTALSYSPNRKVAGAIRRGECVLVVEVVPPADVSRSTKVPTTGTERPESPRFA